MKNNFSGHLAEFMARQFFRVQGYGIIAKNYVTGRRTGAGEIDFIARRGKTIVFVEVKKRRDMETAAEALKPKQIKRIRRAAENFLAGQSRFQGCDIRFDVVLICFPFQIKHIKNAF